MKNSMKVSMKLSLKISQLLNTTRESSSRWYIKKSISVYRKLRYNFRGRYDTIRYIDIEPIFRYFSYIEASLINSAIIIWYGYPLWPAAACPFYEIRQVYQATTPTHALIYYDVYAVPRLLQLINQNKCLQNSAVRCRRIIGVVAGDVHNTCMCTPRSRRAISTGWRKKRGHPISLQIFWKFHDQIAWKLVNFCNIICWTQSLTFCLKISSRCGAT